VSAEHPTPAVEERRQTIVAAALTLLDEDGFDKLSLRRLATHLGMHAPGLYWYIESKQDLYDLMAEAILTPRFAALLPVAPDMSWETWLVELACTTRQALLSHRDGARVAGSAFLLRTNALPPVIETSLEILEASGFDRLVALGATMTAIRYAIGSALGEQVSPFAAIGDDDEKMKAIRSLGASMEAAPWPRMADAYRQLFESDLNPTGGVRDRDRVFRWSVQMFVRGLATSSSFEAPK